ncbi:hypothetical protein [Sorangium sp. So ce131]|uniref:hypothetical protein n=1 Tax=Sorangium sp. So ce131 TaxID=3133282 RepID=UPI003F6288E1
MAEGKFALLEVPDLNGGQPSYLRLGTAAPLGESPGDDLAERIQTFIDDERKRDGCPDFVPVAERKAETAKLHTKGGWRDHSDGNRISTTQGDKIEVIQGNYRMLVLCRGERQAGWDVSGGHITEVSETFGGGTTIEWVQDYGGTWKVVETTVKGEVQTTFHGDVTDYYYGKIKYSQTGTDTFPTLNVIDDYLDDTNPSKPQAIPTENPEILERTWAKSIESYTGSETLPVPTIKDVTWADTMESETHAKSMSDKTFVKGASTSETEAESITSSTKVEGTMKDTTDAGRIESSTTADKIVSVTHAETEDEMYGNANSFTLGNSLTTVVGVESTINVGVVTEVVVGAMAEATLGGEVTLVVGGTVEVTVGATLSSTIGPTVEFSVGPTLELGTTSAELHLSKTELSLTRKVLAGMNIYL